MTHFLKNLIEDLKEHRLWPIAVGLALAVIAVPVVLSKPAKNSAATTTASAGTTGAGLTGASLPELKPAVSISPAAGSTERKSVTRLTRKNPFEPLIKPKAPSTGGGDGAATSGAAMSDGGSSTGADAGAGSGAGAPTSTGGGDSTGSTGNGSSGVTYFAYVAKVKFGELGQTKTLTLQQLRSLPSSDNPVVVFMGATLDGEKAVFLVSADADLKGDGSCKPSADKCVFLYMGVGDTQTFEVAGSDGSLKTYELKLTSIDTKVIDKAPSGAASSKSTGRAKAGSAKHAKRAKGAKHAKRAKHSTKRQRRQARIAKRKEARVAKRRETRLAKRARQAQAGRYFNAFGRVGF